MISCKSIILTLQNNIDISGFVSKAKYHRDKSELEKKIIDADKKIPDTSNFVKKKTDFNAKISEIENKIPDINVLTAVENKIPQVSHLVKKTDYDTKY